MPKLRIDADTPRRAIMPDTRLRLDALPGAFRAEAIAERLMTVREQMKDERIKAAIIGYKALVDEMEGIGGAEAARFYHLDTEALLTLIEDAAARLTDETTPHDAALAALGDFYDSTGPTAAEHDPADDLAAQSQEA